MDLCELIVTESQRILEPILRGKSGLEEVWPYGTPLELEGSFRDLISSVERSPLENLQALLSLSDDFAAALLGRWISCYHPEIAALFEIMGAHHGFRPELPWGKLDLNALLEFLRAPTDRLSELYLDADGYLDDTTIFPAVARVMGLLGYQSTPLSHSESADAPADTPKSSLNLILGIPGISSTGLQLRRTGQEFLIATLSGTIQIDVPLGPLQVTVVTDSSVSYRINRTKIVSESGDFSGNLCLTLPRTSWLSDDSLELGDFDDELYLPGGDFLGIINPADEDLHTHAEIQNGASSIEVGDISIAASFSSIGDSNTYSFEAKLSDLNLHISLEGADTFVRDTLPERGINATVSVSCIYDSNGFRVSGKVGGDLVFPLDVTFLAIKLHELRLHLDLDSDRVGSACYVSLGLTVEVDLDFVQLLFQDVGLEATLGASPLALDFGFKPPTGLGLVIDAPGLTGGGFIHFEPDEGRYWGALELNFADLAQISAFVLIETKIPGIDFSFLAMLFADDLNIPLGMGFVLQGVGGMFAMNRGVDQKALEDIFWAGRANTLLFPGPEAVKNAASLFTDLRAIFPARDGQFVFGPAVKIDWGTPTVVSLSLGIFVELPDPVTVTLVGTLQAGFPILDAPLIQINVDLLGRFDPEGEFFYLYGHLRDSNILGIIELTGDMALVINWGPHPYFAFSVGGFHPSYSAPADFPKLKRITASIHEGPFNLEQQTYLALTSNSLQFGESVEASFEVAGFGLKGGYSYDCLFQWDPLYLEANFAAHLDILAGGETIFSCRISANLSGPSPWRLWGEAYLDLWLFEVSLPFDIPFGGRREQEQLPAPPIQEIFTTELSDLTHWQGSLRGQRSPVRTQLHGQKGLVDPLCTLSFSQDKMPLGEVLEQYGSRPLPTPVTMAITGVSYNETSLAPLTPVMGPFARGQFKQLTNAQRLSLPDFESFEAGKAVDAQALMASGDGLDYNLTFETHVVKDQNSAGQKLDARNVRGTLLRQQRALSSAHRAQFPHTRGRKTPDLSDCLEGLFSR